MCDSMFFEISKRAAGKKGLAEIARSFGKNISSDTIGATTYFCFLAGARNKKKFLHLFPDPKGALGPNTHFQMKSCSSPHVQNQWTVKPSITMLVHEITRILNPSLQLSPQNQSSSTTVCLLLWEDWHVHFANYTIQNWGDWFLILKAKVSGS